MLEKVSQLLKGSLATTVGFAIQVSPGDITSSRARALVGAAAGLISLIIGGLALVRAARYIGSGSGKMLAILALIAGLIGIVLSVLHLSAGTGGFGTGGGRLGAIVGIILALIGIILAVLAYLRSVRSPNIN